MYWWSKRKVILFKQNHIWGNIYRISRVELYSTIADSVRYHDINLFRKKECLLWVTAASPRVGDEVTRYCISWLRYPAHPHPHSHPHPHPHPHHQPHTPSPSICYHVTSLPRYFVTSPSAIPPPLTATTGRKMSKY